MNRFRTAFALLFQVLILQVSVLGGGMACAPEWSSSAEPSHSGTAHAIGRHTPATPASPAAHAAHAAADAPDDSAPSHAGGSSHCAGAAGCSGVVVPTRAPTEATVAIVHESVTTGRVLSPRWTDQAPEPPPPRA